MGESSFDHSIRWGRAKRRPIACSIQRHTMRSLHLPLRPAGSAGACWSLGATAIAKELGIGRASVCRVLEAGSMPAELALAAQAEVIRHNAGAMLESASPRTAG